jgi:hypothetical protein
MVGALPYDFREMAGSPKALRLTPQRLSACRLVVPNLRATDIAKPKALLRSTAEPPPVDWQSATVLHPQ